MKTRFRFMRRDGAKNAIRDGTARGAHTERRAEWRNGCNAIGEMSGRNDNDGNRESTMMSETAAAAPASCGSTKRSNRGKEAKKKPEQSKHTQKTQENSKILRTREKRERRTNAERTKAPSRKQNASEAQTRRNSNNRSAELDEKAVALSFISFCLRYICAAHSREKIHHGPSRGGGRARKL